MSETAAETRTRTRVAKGRRPRFLQNPESDRLLAMIVALSGEIAVLRERLDTYEQLAGAGKLPDREALETFEPDQALEDAREADRQALLSRVFRVIEATPDEDPDSIEREYRHLVEEAEDD